MRKPASLLPLLIVFFAISCKTADDQVPEIASDYCNCFATMQKEVSSKTVSIMTAASTASDPQASLESQLDALPDDDKMTVAVEMMSLGQLEDETSELGRCMKATEKKYKKSFTFNEKKFNQKVIRELESKGCSVTAAIMKLGLNIQEKKQKAKK